MEQAGRGQTFGGGREGSGRSRALQSEPVLHANQRCGGCAAAVNHPHKGPPAPFPLSGLRTSLPTASPEPLGSVRRLGMGEQAHQQEEPIHTQQIQAEAHRVGPIQSWVGPGTQETTEGKAKGTDTEKEK